MRKLGSLFLLLSVFSLSVIAQNSKPYQVINTFHIASAGGWDYLDISPVHDWLYVSHGTQVNILNKQTGDSIAVIENTTGVHGIAFDIADQKGFTSNGRLNSVTVFDLNTNKVLAQIPAGQNPDAIIYEPYTKKIITCNGRGKNLSIIDPITNTLKDSIAVGGKPETPVSDGKGKLFVNIEDKNEIVVIDLKSLQVQQHWSLLPGESPTGLAMDPTTNRLFAGCEKLLIVLDAITGKLITKIAIGDGCDGVAFDATTKMIFTSNGAEGTVSIIHEETADRFITQQTLLSKKGARTIALDKSTHLVYLPTADLEAPDPNQKGRPRMIPGTFQILVVGK